MRLHTYKDEFDHLISLVARQKHLPEAAVETDYYIVLLLQNLERSPYADQCIFKGGTSLSKCYPGSIERFSEDIDLTYLGEDGMSDSAYSKKIKEIEKAISKDAHTEKIDAERSNRSKSMYVWFDGMPNKIKLEIGSSIRPDPYSSKSIKTYIHEFLEEHDAQDEIEMYQLESVSLNVLDITRTFIDKVMSVKRHALSGTLSQKVRHIYDVTRLYNLPEVQELLSDKKELKRLVRLTKDTDSFYLEKRHIDTHYDPSEPYNFESWRSLLNNEIRLIYENLHKQLLYTDEKQDFEKALQTFTQIDELLKSIDE